MDGADWIIWLDSNQRRQRAHGKVASDTPPLSSLSAPLLLHKAVLVVVRACGRDEMVVLAHHVAWSFAEVSMSNINTVIYLDDSIAFNFIRACEIGGLHVLFTIMNSQITSCYFVQRKELENSSVTLRADSFYQLMENAIVMLKAAPLHGDLLCQHKKVLIGDTLCHTPVYKLTNFGSFLDAITLEAMPKAGKIASTVILTMPIIVRRGNWSFKTLNSPIKGVTKHIRMAMNEVWMPLTSKHLEKIEGAVYTLLTLPAYGGIYLNEVQIQSFRAFHLDQELILYHRSYKHIFDILQDEFHLLVCTDWPECYFNVQIIHIQVDLFPVEAKTIFYDLQSPLSDCSRCVSFKPDHRLAGTLQLTLKPTLGVVMLEGVEIEQINSKYLSQYHLSYYRRDWNMSNDEFAFEQIQPPITFIFRVLITPLVKFKTLFVTLGKELILNARLLDISSLQHSTERLKKEGFVRADLSLKKALQFDFPLRTSVGSFVRSTSIDPKGSRLQFTFKELLDGGIKFQPLSNTSIQLSESIEIHVLASMFMAPQQVTVKITIISGEYNIQNNILLSDFVEDAASVLPSNELPSSPPYPRESESLKIWFAIGIGIVCGIVCVLVTIAYFLLRRWRRKERIQTQIFPHPIMHVECMPPKVTTRSPPDADQLPPSGMAIPLTVVKAHKAIPQTKSRLLIEAVPSEEDACWSRQKLSHNVSSSTLCFLPPGVVVQDELEWRQSIPRIFSPPVVTSPPPSQSQPSYKCLSLQQF
ncbi:unnamed protein product [Hydatigera taeniaeformis]|uniref:VPS13_C domain-containing protein n=1 Tax=Hydatigena taeniaeformis TaxID=6205 RepID=A0A0R3X892_HYDTA|nr:unnamed protein product [Hydatigera taeniaeformis]